MKTSDFDYHLPPSLIAQHPPPERTAARMMVIDRRTGTIEHAGVADLPLLLRAGDLLVINDTRVIPARLYGRKMESRGRVEVLLLEDMGQGKWSALCRMSGRARPGLRLVLAGGRIAATVVSMEAGGEVILEIASAEPILAILDEEGQTPLPPYIRRRDGPLAEDRLRYQTVYAKVPGAVAAPTAGLHFTRELLAELVRRGVRQTSVTLHVGAGTFKPVKSDDVEGHKMDFERFSIPRETADLIGTTRAAGGRVVAVGTTTVRALETAAMRSDGIAVCSGRTDLFVVPPFQFKAVDAILTNFHLPRSTLLMMMCAFAGRDMVLRAYRQAVLEKYRFYSFGDCMLVL